MTSRTLATPRFTKKRVLITGGSQGIGFATGALFAREGARVALNAPGRPDVETAVTHLPPGEHLALAADVASECDVVTMMDRAYAGFGGLDILVCNAGIQIPEASEELTMQAFNQVMAVNVGGVVACAREALRRWKAEQRQGVIVVTSSVHQTIPKPGYLGYSASKGAIGNIVRTLALEFARNGVRVNAVAPGAIVTPMNDGWTNDPQARANVSRHIPMNRPGEADEIAEAIAYLASDAASYVTGQTLYVDGGLSLYNDFAENWAS